jgi:hypothetical protein
VSICRVPSPEFSQAPEHIQLVHQCRFAVRARLDWSLVAFPGRTSCEFAGFNPRPIQHLGCAARGFAYEPPTHQKPGLPTPGSRSTRRPHIASNQGAGILTCFPSTTAFALALGADSPCADERCAGNLGLSASGPFTRFNATHVSIRTSHTSRAPHRTPSQA